MTGQPGRSGRHPTTSDNIRRQPPTTARPPKGMTKRARELWKSLIAGGGVTDSDLPQLRDAFQWYAVFETAIDQLETDVANKELRVSAEHSYDKFQKTIKLIGCDPARMKSRPLSAAEKKEIEQAEAERVAEQNRQAARRNNPQSLRAV